MEDKIVPTESVPQEELIDQLLSYVKLVVDDIGSGAKKISSFDLLLPVATDAGLFLDHDRAMYVFDMVEDHDLYWHPTRFSLRGWEASMDAIPTVEKMLTDQINNASKAQLVHYVRWAFNIITRG